MEKFQHFLLDWYGLYGRHNLPWRLTNDPYAILLSEIMLQQTQVDRVIPKYQSFLKRFPDLRTLATATLADVLTLWQGLGYNRRAKYLHQLAKTIAHQSDSTYEMSFPKLPQDISELEKLPGIGPYTARAVSAFAFHQPVTLIETNVRTVFLYHFFPRLEAVSDSELEPLVAQALYTPDPQKWYWALMDYGSYLKSVLPNPNRRSKSYTKQSKFQGSLRQVRGEILRILISQTDISVAKLKKMLTGNTDHFQAALDQLLKEQLLIRSGSNISLPK